MTDTPHIPPEVEARLDEILGKVIDYIYETDRGGQKYENGELSTEEAKAKLAALFTEHSAERERLILKKDIKYLTLKARYQRMFLGGEEDALVTKRRKKQLIKRLAQLSTTNKKEAEDVKK